MTLCNVLLFGHGRDGENVHVDYDNTGHFTYSPKTTMHACGPGGELKTVMRAVDEQVDYVIVCYRSKSDGKVYLIGTEDGLLPFRVEDRIRAERLVSSPF